MPLWKLASAGHRRKRRFRLHRLNGPCSPGGEFPGRRKPSGLHLSYSTAAEIPWRGDSSGAPMQRRAIDVRLTWQQESQLEPENAQLRKLVADLSFEKALFEEVTSGN